MIDDLEEKTEKKNDTWGYWLIIVMALIYGRTGDNWYRNDYHKINEGEENDDRKD